MIKIRKLENTSEYTVVVRTSDGFKRNLHPQDTLEDIKINEVNLDRIKKYVKVEYNLNE